jgi:hypothetical protein
MELTIEDDRNRRPAANVGTGKEGEGCLDVHVKRDAKICKAVVERQAQIHSRLFLPHFVIVVMSILGGY